MLSNCTCITITWLQWVTNFALDSVHLIPLNLSRPFHFSFLFHLSLPSSSSIYVYAGNLELHPWSSH